MNEIQYKYSPRSAFRAFAYEHTDMFNFSIKCTYTLPGGLKRSPRKAEGWVFESQPRQTLVVKTGSDNSTAKRSAIGVSVTGARR